MSNELIMKALDAYINKDEKGAKQYIHEYAVRTGQAILNEAWDNDEELPEFGGDYDENLKTDIVDAQDEIDTEMDGLSEEAFDDVVDEEGLTDRVMELENEVSELPEKIDNLTQTVEDFKNELQTLLDSELSNELGGDEEIPELDEIEAETDEFEEVDTEMDNEVDEFDFDDESGDLEELEEGIEFHTVKVPEVKQTKSEPVIKASKVDEPFKDAKLGVAKGKSDAERKVAVKVDDQKNVKKSSKEFYSKK